MVAGVVRNVQLRVDQQQLVQGVLHGEDAADDHRTLGVDVGRTGEYFGEVVGHAQRDSLVLLGSTLREFAVTALRRVGQQLHLAQHVLARGRQLACLVGLLQHAARLGVVFRVDEPARTVASVVAYIIRCIAFGRGGELLRGSGIGPIAVGRHVAVVLEVLFRVLGKQRCRAGQGQRE